jgi:hypothetical protein
VLDDVFARSFRAATTALHEGKWNGPNGDRFVPGRIENGIFTPSLRCNFPVLVTPEQRQAAEKEAKRIHEIRKKDAHLGSIAVGNHGIDVTIANARKKIWDNKIVPGIDCFAKKIFGKFAYPVAETIKVILTYLTKILDWIFYPLYWLIFRPIKNLHVSLQIKTLEKNVACPIHESLCMQLVDMILDEHVKALQALNARAPQA